MIVVDSVQEHKISSLKRNDQIKIQFEPYILFKINPFLKLQQSVINLSIKKCYKQSGYDQMKFAANEIAEVLTQTEVKAEGKSVNLTMKKLSLNKENIFM